MSTFSCVNDKISAVFKTVNRPLNPGEEPKRPGETHVFEAVNELSPAFQAVLDQPMTVSWKIDGTCCKIENGVYYRRRDIRKGSVPPPGSVPGDVVDGHVNVAWVPLNTSTDPEDKWHLTALTSDKKSVWILDRFKQVTQLALSDVTTPTTFELVGPKIQNNLYDIDLVDVEIKLRKGVQTAPKHYLIPHGAFEAPFDLVLLKQPNCLDLVREFVKDHMAEGLVFRCGDKYFKVNQGHLCCHKQNTKLLLAGK
jgi:hypothetical protein